MPLFIEQFSSYWRQILADFLLLFAIVFAVFVSITLIGSGCGKRVLWKVNLPGYNSTRTNIAEKLFKITVIEVKGH